MYAVCRCTEATVESQSETLWLCYNGVEPSGKPKRAWKRAGVTPCVELTMAEAQRLVGAYRNRRVVPFDRAPKPAKRRKRK